MLAFSNVKVLPSPPVDIKLMWTLSGDESLNSYTINVYRGESQSSDAADFTCIASGIDSSVNYYIDDSATFYSTNRSFFYYFIASGASVYTSEIYDATSYLNDYAANEIIRRQRIAVYNNRYNRRSWIVLLQKTEGDRCTTCWDAETGRTILSRCPECYGVGFTGGYRSPIEIKGMVNLAPTRNQIVVFGTWEDNDGILTVLNFPWLKQGDVLVNSFGERWRIVQVHRVEKGRILISQTLQIRRLKDDEPVYDIDVRSYFE